MIKSPPTTATHFADGIGPAQFVDWVSQIAPDTEISLYVHVPFCRRLCWFCACRTQGTRTLAPVEAYIGTLEKELALLRDVLPNGLRMGRMHWGGGTPTILPPDLIERLAKAVKAVIPPTEDWEFSVEIDPNELDAARVEALARAGMNRASIGVQDFDEEIQKMLDGKQTAEEAAAKAKAKWEAEF